MSQTSNDGRTAPPLATPVGHWQLTAGNRAECTVTNFGLRKVRAGMPIVEAVVQVGADGALSVRTVLQLSDIDTGNSRRDKDLAKPHLLDTAAFPTMTFSARGGSTFLPADGSGTLFGTLEARGSAIPVTVEYMVHEPVRGRLIVHVITAFDRGDLGITVPAFMIGRRVQVDFTAEFELLA